MEMLRVDFAEIETSEEDIYYDAVYNGEPFTGIATEDDEETHSEYEYFEGVANGKWITKFTNGNLQAETILDMGEIVSDTVWSKEGKIIYDFIASPLTERQYFENGEIKYNKDDNGYIFYRQDGGILQEYKYSDGHKTIFAPSGAWLVKHRSSGDKSLVMDVKYLEFNDDELLLNWKQWLIDNMNMELYAGGYPDIYPYFIRWISNMMESGKENKVTEIIIEMIQHDNLAIRYEGIVLAMRHKINAAVPYIVKEKENGATPDGYGNNAYGFTLSQIARKAIAEINGINA